MDLPREVYHHPVNLFVVEFMGNPATNILPCVVKAAGPPPVLVVKTDLQSEFVLKDAGPLPEGQEVIVNVRPEDVVFHMIPKPGPFPPKSLRLSQREQDASFMYAFKGGGMEVVLRGPEEEVQCLHPNQLLWLGFKRGNIFDSQSGRLLCSFGFVA